MLREQAKILSGLLALFDLVTVAIAHFYVYAFFHPQNSHDPLFSLCFLSTPCVFVLTLYHAGAYRSFRVSVLREEALLIVRAVLAGGALMLGISWITPEGLPERAALAAF